MRMMRELVESGRAKVVACLITKNGKAHTVEDAKHLLDAEAVKCRGVFYTRRHESWPRANTAELTFIEPDTVEIEG